MIATNLPSAARGVPQNDSEDLRLQRGRDVARRMEDLRAEAAWEVAKVISAVSTKKITAARVPGCSAHGLSRAANGDTSNPLYRIVSLMMLLKKLGLGRERAQRMVMWLQEIVEQLWPDDEQPELGETLEKDSEISGADNHLRLRVATGHTEDAAKLLEIKRCQFAHAPSVIAALRRVVETAAV